jgi:hypothetical protein
MSQFGAKAEKGNANHAFDDPGWVGTLRLDGHTIIEGDAKVRATTGQDGNGIRVGSILRKEDRGTLQRVRATSKEACDGTGHVGENRESSEGPLVKEAGFIVISCRTMSAM